jgi:hypothetical protein
MDPLHIAIALGPLATYLLVLGMINLARRPLVTSGGRDAAALGIALAGLAVIGPMELFLIEEAAVAYGGWVWAMMLATYGLLLSLIILLLRPRLVIYNVRLEELRAILVEVVARLDSESRWASESLAAPKLGVQLHIEHSPLLHSVQLVSSGPDQNIHSWRRLEIALASALRKTRHQGNWFGAVGTGLGLLLLATITYVLARDPDGAVQALNEMLRR